MQSFRQYITELFDKPYDWEWDRIIEDELYLAKFRTESDTIIKVNISKSNFIGRGWTIGFGVDYDTGFTLDTDIELKEYNANKILATVIDVIRTFVSKKNPDMMNFTASKGTSDKLARSRTYKKLLKRELPDEYEVESEDAFGDQMRFRITKES